MYTYDASVVVPRGRKRRGGVVVFSYIYYFAVQKARCRHVSIRFVHSCD
jgi:hypothetical protein